MKQLDKSELKFLQIENMNGKIQILMTYSVSIIHNSSYGTGRRISYMSFAEINYSFT